mmetsp:Transcript_20672/g.49059  ORF Transcript_20672/g.49059 Transcript_20672/m.49059 type:complete len:719 (+) Transcript_20672:26-2182(+)
MVMVVMIKIMTRMMVGVILLATMKTRPVVTASTSTAALASAFAQRYTSSGSTTRTVGSTVRSSTSTSAVAPAASAVSSTSRTLSNRSSFCGTAMRIRTVQRPTTSTGRIVRNASFSSATIVMMPEGPEVRTIVDQLQQGVGKRLIDIQFLSGRYVKHGRPDGFADFAKTMTPIKQKQQQQSSSSPETIDTIVEWNAKGKFIYVVLDDGGTKNDSIVDTNPDFQRSIWITLGMTGQFLSERVHQQDPKYARWYLHLVDLLTTGEDGDSNRDNPKDFKIYYHDQRNFGTVRFCVSAKELETKLKSLGLDILDVEGTTVDDFLEIMSSTKQDMNICKFLMNQGKLSGVGNYILSEALYRSKIDPFASLEELDDKTHSRKLFCEIQAVATESYASKGLTRPKVGTYRSMDGISGSYAFELQCYGRETCIEGNPVIRETNGPNGRAIWYTEDQLFMSRSKRDGGVTWTNHDKNSDDDGDNGETRRPKRVQADNVDLLDGLTDPGWRDVLTKATASESFQHLREFLEQEESNGATIFPRKQDIFQAFNLCPLDQTKVVIIGQDPYHGIGQAHGLSFSVQRGVPPPPSLKNIIKETIGDVGVVPPSHGCLESWAKQGVLLLNTVLTVRSGEANSHKGKGWEDFSDAVVSAINEDENPRVFLLWGRPAAQKAKSVDTSKHVVISTSHPSPLGATKTSSPFLGSKCFSRTNHALAKMGVQPIDWQIR